MQQHEQKITSSSSYSSASAKLPQKTCGGVGLSADCGYRTPVSATATHKETEQPRGSEMLAVNIECPVTEGNNVLLVDWQASFKSRSLEDILLVSSNSPQRSLGHGQGHVTSRWTPADEGRDASLTTSHGSLNTGHASLHGSLEMIQVS